MKGSAATAEIFEPYAEALISIAQSQNLVDEFATNMSGLASVLDGSPELVQFLASPVYPNSRKKAVLEQAFGDQVHPMVKNFLLLLVDRQRIGLLAGIAQAFQTLVRQLRNTVLAEVTSAVELNDGQKQAVVDKVKALSGSDSVELQTNVDADILGGVIIKVGSQVIDSSIRGQLRRITVSLGKSA
jgi:F-type H+-transporting ATPase subunit delta